jgi:peptidoglycan/xylan/chitin deacetylase (PgdA/CDA1 family)
MSAPPTEITAIRSTAVGLAKAAAVAGQIAVWRLRGRPSEPGLRILAYHRISRDRDELAVHPSRFVEQMEIIASSGLRVIDLTELRQDSTIENENTLALTFDDGYHDFLDYALPELHKRRWPATVFVVAGVADGTVRFRWYGSDRHPDLLNWDEMRAIEKEGLVRFEPHSLTHKILPTLSEDEAWREIAGSKSAVEAALGRETSLFCYPGGYYTEREMHLVARAGFTAGVGTEYGPNRTPLNWYGLRRIPADRYDVGAVFRARLHGGTDRPPLGRPERATPVPARS